MSQQPDKTLVLKAVQVRDGKFFSLIPNLPYEYDVEYFIGQPNQRHCNPDSHIMRSWLSSFRLNLLPDHAVKWGEKYEVCDPFTWFARWIQHVCIEGLMWPVGLFLAEAWPLREVVAIAELLFESQLGVAEKLNAFWRGVSQSGRPRSTDNYMLVGAQSSTAFSNHIQLVSQIPYLPQDYNIDKLKNDVQDAVTAYFKDKNHEDQKLVVEQTTLP